MGTTVVTPFGREIKRLRSLRKMTARALASSIRKSVGYVAKIESRGEIPNGKLICEIAFVLDHSPKQLLSLAKESYSALIVRKIEEQHAVALAEHQQRITNTNECHTQFGKAPQMATSISFINMKGGVGKTTIASQIAHVADAHDYRVLAVDLDPQSNLSQSLMQPASYVKHLKAKKPTIVQIFEGYTPASGDGGAPKRINVDDVIVKKVGYWSDSTLDLIPSRLELSRTLKNPTGKERRLAKALSQVQDRYDIIVIDCAPTESILTDAAYFASRFIVVPIKPEFMATIGLPLLARSLKEFQLENDDHEIEIAGVVFNHSSSYSSGPEGQRSIRDVAKIAKSNDWYICDNQVKYSASYAKSAREGTPLSRTSYTRSSVVKGFERLANELFAKIGITKVTT